MRYRSNTGSGKLCMRRVLRIVAASGAIFLSSLSADAQTLSDQSPTQAVVRPAIDFQRRALTISVPIVGVPFPMNYRSDAVAPKWRWSIYHAYDPGANIFSPGNGRPRTISPLFAQLAKTPQWLAIGEVAIAAQDGSEIYIFNHRGDHLRTLSAMTGALVYRFTYGPTGSLVAIEDGYGNTTRIERDAAGFMTAVVAPHGQRTTFKNNDKGYPTKIANPLGETISLDYSPEGQLAVFTDSNKDTYHFAADQTGLLTRLEGPDGGFVDLAQTLADNESKFSWTTAMQRRSVWVAERAPDGAISAVNTDPAGSQTQVQTGTGDTTKVAYPDGRTITQVQEPDARWGRQSLALKTLSLALPSGLTVSLSANRTVSLTDAGNPLSLANLNEAATVNGHSYKRIFDAKSRQVTQITPAGRRIVTTLDEHGRPANIEMQGLLPLSLTYDAQGRFASFKRGQGPDARIISVDYNAQGWLASVTDPLKRTLRLEHDAAGRLSKRILPDGSEIRLKYDANGNLISITPPGRPSHTFQYARIGKASAYLPPSVDQTTGNSAGKHGFWASITSFLARVWNAIRRLFGKSRTAPPTPEELAPGDKAYLYNNDEQLTKVLRAGGSSVEFAYDKGGRLTATKGSDGEFSITYDPKTGLQARATSSDGVSLAPTYDGSLLTHLDWSGPIQGTVGFAHDNSLRTSSISVDDGSPVKLEYDADGLLTRAGNLSVTRDSSTGLLTKTTLGNVTTAEEYNGFGEPVVHRATYKNDEMFSDRFERDALGRVVQKTETIDSQSTVYRYAYDLAGRLTDVSANGTPTAHYDYDPNGNRIGYSGRSGTAKASYDAQDRLKQYGNATFAHTPNGEWLSKTAGGQTTAYTYDGFGNLKGVSIPDGTKIDYVVDGLNRRVAKKVNGKPVQAFLYQDQLKVIAELDGANQVVSRFVYANDSNVPDYMIKGGKTYRIVTDALGSPRIVMEADTGAIAQRMDYDEFGNVLSDTNPGFQPFGFEGGLYDNDTKLIRFGARDYDPFTGRWAAKDRVWQPTADGNLYSHVRNDPVNLIDQDGNDPDAVTNQIWKQISVPATVYGVYSALDKINKAGQLTSTVPNPFANPVWDALEPGGGFGATMTVDAPASAILGGGGVGLGGAITAGLGVMSAGALGYGVGYGLMHNPLSDSMPANPFNWFDPNAWGRNGTVGGQPRYSLGDLGRGQLGSDLGDTDLGNWARCLFADDPSGCGGIQNWQCYARMLMTAGLYSGCGRGTGDIHMETFDGRRYDFQAAGEFVATQDPTGGAKVEFRLEPPIKGSSVTVCTAVAASVDGTKVAIQLKPQPQVYINDKPANIEPGRGTRLGKSGEIRFTEASSWIISWPDGTAARVRPVGWYLDVEVRPGSSSGKLIGLLGNADGKPAGDLVTRDGVVLGADFTSKDLYGRFGESWRISQKESLFHYGKGESTATFTDRSVPRENVTVATLDPAARAEAERQCRAAGITAPAALAECTIDFAMTGDRRFLASAALVQAVRPEIPEPSSGALTGGKPAGSVMVSGTGKETYNVFDAAGKNLTSNRPTNSVFELPAGMYTVTVNGSQQRVEVTAGQQAVVRAGSLMVFGTGKEAYNVFDSAGKAVLAYSRPTNSVIELLPGTYTVFLNNSQQRAEVTAGQQAVVRAGSLMVSGTGKEAYNVFDSTGKAVLVYSRPTNSVIELLPGTYVVQVGTRKVTVSVQAGERKTINP